MLIRDLIDPRTRPFRGSLLDAADRERNCTID